MKKSILWILRTLLCLSLLTGCKAEPNASKRDTISFVEGQYYAVAYLGYQQIDNLDDYVEQYLDSDRLPIHYFSDGDYYLVIPRYSGMGLSLYHNDLETSQSTLVYEDPDCEPFLIQCNVSDIFADATIQLTYQNEVVEFSPFISLEDGSVDIGEHGLKLTKDTDK